MAALKQPPGWPPPNTMNPQTRGSLGIFAVTATITAAILSLRLYSRLCLTKTYGIDDLLLAAGFVRFLFHPVRSC
jgi:hypothetical protein